jgi:cytidyltransferase-like protein
MSVGVLVSSFDLLNVGDLDVLRQARQRCDRLIVAVLSDSDVETRTGLPPIVQMSERLAIVQAVRGVDEAVPFDPERLAALQPDLLMTDSSADVGGEVLMPRRHTSSPLLEAVLAAHRKPCVND